MAKQQASRRTIDDSAPRGDPWRSEWSRVEAATPRSVLYLKPKPGMQDALIDVFRRIGVPGNALKQEGCLSVEAQAPPDPDAPILVTVLWTHREAYEGWLANPWREYSGAELAPFLEGDSSAILYDVVLADGDVSTVAAGAPVAGTARGGARPGWGRRREPHPLYRPDPERWRFPGGRAGGSGTARRCWPTCAMSWSARRRPGRSTA